MAAIPNPWIGIPAGLAAGFIASGVVGKIQDWLRQRYGPSTGPLSQEYEAAAAAQQPLAYQAGRVAPIAAGMTTGAGVGAGVRAVSGALLGGADVAQQAITKGPSNIDWREAGIQAGAGALLPQARPWAGGARPEMATAAPTLGEEGAVSSGQQTGTIVPKTKVQQGKHLSGEPLAPGEQAAKQEQGQQTEASGVTSSAKGTAEQKPPPANSRLAQVDQNTVLPGETISVVQSNRQGLKAAPVTAEGIEGAPSTVVDTAPIPADIASASEPATPQGGAQPALSPTYQAPAEAPSGSPAPPPSASLLQPSGRIQNEGIVSSAPPEETSLADARVPQGPTPPEGPTPTGLRRSSP